MNKTIKAVLSGLPPLFIFILGIAVGIIAVKYVTIFSNWIKPIEVVTKSPIYSNTYIIEAPDVNKLNNKKGIIHYHNDITARVLTINGDTLTVDSAKVKFK